MSKGDAMEPVVATPRRGPLETLNDILGMIKFSHTLFALPFAVLSVIMAVSDPGMSASAPPKVWLGILLCMVAARSAAMAFNRLADRHLDARNPRTAERHLPAGRLSVPAVAIFTAASCVLFVASTLLFLPDNPWPLRLSVPVLAWLLGYSYAKRFTSLAHYWLGAGLMMAPIAAWIAVTGAIAIAPVLLGLAVFFWVGGFDILYACQDAEFDRAAGLRSLPARLGVAGSLRLAAVSHALMIGVLVLLGLQFPPFGWLYMTGVGVVAVVLIYEHALVKPNDLSRVNLAFFYLNVAISLGLMAVGGLDCLTTI